MQFSQSRQRSDLGGLAQETGQPQGLPLQSPQAAPPNCNAIEKGRIGQGRPNKEGRQFRLVSASGKATRAVGRAGLETGEAGAHPSEKSVSSHAYLPQDGHPDPPPHPTPTHGGPHDRKAIQPLVPTSRCIANVHPGYQFGQLQSILGCVEVRAGKVYGSQVAPSVQPD